MTEPDVDYLNEVAGITIKDQIHKFIKYVETLNLSNLAKDVSPFLVNSPDAKRVIHFNEFLQSKLD